MVIVSRATSMLVNSIITNLKKHFLYDKHNQYTKAETLNPGVSGCYRNNIFFAASISSENDSLRFRYLMTNHNDHNLTRLGFFFLPFFSYLVRCPTSYERAQNTRLNRELTRAILHIASLAAHTTLNTYKPMEINIERSPQH